MAARLSNELLLVIFEMAVQKEKLRDSPIRSWYTPLKGNEISFLTVDYKQILKMMRVFRPLQALYNELLYENVVIKMKQQMNSFMRSIRSDNSNPQLASARAACVRSLIVTDGILSAFALENLLASFTQLKYFAVVPPVLSKYINRINAVVGNLYTPYVRSLSYLPHDGVGDSLDIISRRFAPPSVFDQAQKFTENELLSILETFPSDYASLNLLELVGSIWHAAGPRSLRRDAFPHQNGITRLQLCGGSRLLRYCHTILDLNPQTSHVRLVYSGPQEYKNEPMPRGVANLAQPFPGHVHFISLENLCFEEYDNYDMFAQFPATIQGIEIIRCKDWDNLTTYGISHILSDNQRYPFPDLKSFLVSEDSICDNPPDSIDFDYVTEDIAKKWVHHGYGDYAADYTGRSIGDVGSSLLRPYLYSTGFLRPDVYERLYLDRTAHVSDPEVEAALSALIEADCEQHIVDECTDGIRNVRQLLRDRGIDGGSHPSWAFWQPLTQAGKLKVDLFVFLIISDDEQQTKITDYLTKQATR